MLVTLRDQRFLKKRTEKVLIAMELSICTV